MTPDEIEAPWQYFNLGCQVAAHANDMDHKWSDTIKCAAVLQQIANGDLTLMPSSAEQPTIPGDEANQVRRTNIVVNLTRERAKVILDGYNTMLRSFDES